MSIYLGIVAIALFVAVVYGLYVDKHTLQSEISRASSDPGNMYVPAVIGYPILVALFASIGAIVINSQ